MSIIQAEGSLTWTDVRFNRIHVFGQNGQKQLVKWCNIKTTRHSPASKATITCQILLFAVLTTQGHHKLHQSCIFAGILYWTALYFTGGHVIVSTLVNVSLSSCSKCEALLSHTNTISTACWTSASHKETRCPRAPHISQYPCSKTPVTW